MDISVSEFHEEQDKWKSVVFQDFLN